MGKLFCGRVSNAVLSGVMIVALVLPSAGRADVADEGWGDLGYTQSEAEVEAIPDSLESQAVEPSPQALAANPEADSVYANPVTTESLNTEASSASTADVVIATSEDQLPGGNEAAARAETKSNAGKTAKSAVGTSTASSNSSKSSRSFGNISTARNTHGVMTEESPGVQFYIAPFAGTTSIMGNTTVYNTSKLAFGVQGGILLGSSFLLGVSYTFSEQSLSSPRINSTNGSAGGFSDVFALKSNHIELGGKLYFLGRESRLRPFFGGGFGWAKNFLNYTTANLQGLGYQPAYVKDYTFSQFDGFGEVGAEVAITRMIVASASFKLRGVLGSSTPTGDEAASFDSEKAAAGSSVSRSASYTIGAGLGIYF